jgi:hypothetical protein
MQWWVWLRRAEASEYLRAVHGVVAAPATLANLAHRGGGPRYTRQGQRLTAYHRDDLDAWAATRMSQRVKSTSELPPRRSAPTESQAA